MSGCQIKFFGGWSAKPTAILINDYDKTIHFFGCHYLPFLGLYPDGIFPQKYYSCSISEIDWFTAESLVYAQQCYGFCKIKSSDGIVTFIYERTDTFLIPDKLSIELQENNVTKRTWILDIPRFIGLFLILFFLLIGSMCGGGCISPLINNAKVGTLDIGLFVGGILGSMIPLILINPLMYRFFYAWMERNSEVARFFNPLNIFIILAMVVSMFLLIFLFF